MSMRRQLCLVAAFCLSLFLAFSNLFGLEANAAETIVELTPAQTLALFGSTIDAEYNINLNEYDDCTFQYVGYVSDVFDASNLTDSDFLTSYTVANSYTYLVYACFDTAYQTTAQYTDFQFQLIPQISITDLSFFRTSVLYGITTNSNSNSGTPTAYPSSVTLDIDGSSHLFSGLTAAAPYTGFRGWIRSAQGDFPLPNGVSSSQYVFGAISSTYRDTNTFSLTGMNIDLFGMTKFTSTDVFYSDCYFVLVQCPLLSDGYNGGGGSGGGSGGAFSPEIVIANGYFDVDGNIELELDLDQLLELLNYIAEKEGFTQSDLDESLEEDGPLSWIGENVADAVGGIFMPDDDAFEDFSDSISDSFDEHLGGLSDVYDLLDEQVDYLRAATSADTIYLGQIHAPVQFDRAGEPVQYFDIGGYDVELKPYPEKLSLLYDALAYMIDITAVFMVLNMLKTKKDIILNPEGESIHYDN